MTFSNTSPFISELPERIKLRELARSVAAEMNKDYGEVLDQLIEIDVIRKFGSVTSEAQLEYYRNLHDSDSLRELSYEALMLLAEPEDDMTEEQLKATESAQAALNDLPTWFTDAYPA